MISNFETKKFNFNIRATGRRTWDKETGKEVFEPDGAYQVFLPHSCDAWDITYGTREACIEELESFIKEAQEILQKLKNG